MGFKKGENPNHPRKGAAIKADPIRSWAAIAKIERQLREAKKERDLCLFILGVNTAWRASELLSMRVWQVQDLKGNPMLTMKQPKTGEYRTTPLNRTAQVALRQWVAFYRKTYPSKFDPKAPLFPSRTGCCLLVSSFSRNVKNWCIKAGLIGHFSSHTIRKTWAYHQRVTYKEPVILISKALGHSSEAETLAYLGILPEEIGALYKNRITGKIRTLLSIPFKKLCVRLREVFVS